MSRFSKVLSLAVVLATLASFTGTAKAQCPRCGGGFNGSYGFGYSGSLYGLGYIPVPPYFAIHPPVYYGDRVRRTYGQSPYAAMPHNVEVAKSKPKVVLNSTLKKAPKADTKPELKEVGSQTAAVRPQLILNPFVESNRGKLVAGSK